MGNKEWAKNGNGSDSLRTTAENIGTGGSNRRIKKVK